VSYSFAGKNAKQQDANTVVNLSMFNPKAGLSYVLPSGQLLYGSYAVAQREPNRNDYVNAVAGTTPQKEILHDGNPVIPMITSVQSNRSGITNNRQSQNIIDDESIVSLSDRITQFCSHMFILRNKTVDEIESEGRSFGTHKLINVKARHLGKDIAGAVEPVRVGDTLRKNFINLEFKNFCITERGDLRDIARVAEGNMELEENESDSIPNFN
jgi:hypothetical protein